MNCQVAVASDPTGQHTAFPQTPWLVGGEHPIFKNPHTSKPFEHRSSALRKSPCPWIPQYCSPVVDGLASMSNSTKERTISNAHKALVMTGTYNTCMHALLWPVRAGTAYRHLFNAAGKIGKKINLAHSASLLVLQMYRYRYTDIYCHSCVLASFYLTEVSFDNS